MDEEPEKSSHSALETREIVSYRRHGEFVQWLGFCANLWRGGSLFRGVMDVK
jgi:hypothetical protein